MSRKRHGKKSLEQQEQDIGIEEFHAILGLMIFLGLHHDTKNPTKDLWCDKGAQRPLYRAVVDRARFSFIPKCLSFHDCQLLRIQYTDDI